MSNIIYTNFGQSQSICAVAGTGGSGIVSFRHEAHVPYGGPDGGNGGNGGSVVVEADYSMRDLSYFIKKSVFVAEDGGNGGKRNRNGKSAPTLIVKVPVGASIWDYPEQASENEGVGECIAELHTNGNSTVVARGGKGGRGNVRFLGSVNRSPLLAEAGVKGESKRLLLTTTITSDVAVLGLPNSGKSTVVGALTNAKVVVDQYPFSTIEPVLGTIMNPLHSFTIIDLPPLRRDRNREDSMQAKVLNACMNSKIVLLILDATGNPIKDLNELALLVDQGFQKVTLAICMMRLEAWEVELHNVTEAAAKLFDREVPVFAISNDGSTQIQNLHSYLMETLRVLLQKESELQESEIVIEPSPIVVPNPGNKPLVKANEKGTYTIVHGGAVRIARGSDLNNWDVLLQFRTLLERLNVIKALQEQGIQKGDVVRVANKEFTWE